MTTRLTGRTRHRVEVLKATLTKPKRQLLVLQYEVAELYLSRLPFPDSPKGAVDVRKSVPFPQVEPYMAPRRVYWIDATPEMHTQQLENQNWIDK